MITELPKPRTIFEDQHFRIVVRAAANERDPDVRAFDVETKMQDALGHESWRSIFCISTFRDSNHPFEAMDVLQHVLALISMERVQTFRGGLVDSHSPVLRT